MSGETPGEVVRRLGDFTRQRLPQLNTACRDGLIDLTAWLDEVVPTVEGFDILVPELSPAERELLLRAGGTIVCSAERLAQPALPPGEVVTQLPGLEAALVAAAGPDRVPALTHHRYWITNLEPDQLTFSGEPHEKFFISAVQTQTALRACSVNGLLRRITTGLTRPGTSECARLLSAAAAGLEEARRAYRDFNHGPDGLPQMTPAQFNEMRIWLPKTKLGGVPYGGPNAAYIGEMVVTDFLFGTADDDYSDYVAEFLNVQDPDEREATMADMHGSSVADMIGRSMGYDNAEALASAPVPHLAQHLLGSPGTQATCSAALALHTAFCGGTGAHFGLITTHLIKYGATLTHKERAALPIDPGNGVGGHGHEATRRLLEMRRNAPVYVAIKRAMQIIARPEDAA